MKKLLLISGCMLTLAMPVLSQPCSAHFMGIPCIDTIPTEANVISSTTDIGPVVNECYWVCPGSELTIDGISSGNLNIDMEAGSILNFTGNESTIWAKSGCTINILDCMPYLIIFMEPDVIVNYDPKDFCPVMDTCEEIIFDYSEAPSPGCLGVEIATVHVDPLHIYPNPVNESITIDIKNPELLPGVIHITDINGTLMFSDYITGTNENKILVSTKDFHAGFYIISVNGIQKIFVVMK